MDAIYVVGAGGIGCAAGFALRVAGVPVIFVDSNPRKVEAGRREGVGVAGQDSLDAEFLHFEAWRPTSNATVLLCTKCYDNAAVLARLPDDANLIPIQNGFDPQLAAHGHEFEGIASFVSECDPDRPRTRITRAGVLHLGRRVAGLPTSFPASLLASLARARLFRVASVSSIDPYKHAKLMYNAAISPLTAAAGIDNGRLLSDPTTRRLFFALLRENYRILSSAGLELGRIGPLPPRGVAWILRHPWLANRLARAFEPSLRGTYCSMAGEIQTGRTELDNYNGHLIRLARRHGTPCPLNQMVFDLVSRMTADHQTPHAGVWRDLLAA